MRKSKPHKKAWHSRLRPKFSRILSKSQVSVSVHVQRLRALIVRNTNALVVLLVVALASIDLASERSSLVYVSDPQENGELPLIEIMKPFVKDDGSDQSPAGHPNESSLGVGVEPSWSFFKPVWKTQPSLSVGTPARNPYKDPALDLIEPFIFDPLGRIETEFRPTGNVLERVQFWIGIYTRFNQRMRVVHDRHEPSRVYGYIDFTPLYDSPGSSAAIASRCWRIEKEILKELKVRLLDAGDISPISTLSPYEKGEIKALLSQFGAASPSRVAALASSIRTQTGQRDEFLAAIRRSKELLPYIESVFKKEGLPVALARIPFIESSFNPKAISKVGAVGVWQFMPDTARQMISSDNPTLWADPLRQTRAAAKVFRIYRSLLPDWGTTVTSYNSGVGRLRRLSQKYKAKGLETILLAGDDNGLGFAGENFFAQFITANVVEQYKHEIYPELREPSTPSSIAATIPVNVPNSQTLVR